MIKNLFSKVAEIWTFLISLLIPEDVKVERLASLELYKLRALFPKAERVPDKLSSPIFNYRNKNVRTCIWAIKYKAHPIITERMSNFLYEEILAIAEEELLMQGKIGIALVPVPMSRRRMRKYGFNQCRLVCEEVSRIDRDIKIIDILEKVRETSHQTRLSRTERIRNMKESMRVKIDLDLEMRNYLLVIIDDVYTTGATIKEARRALGEAGFKDTLAITLAH